MAEQAKTASDDKEEEKRPAVDSGKYLAQIAESLSNDERDQLFGLLDGKEELNEKIRQHYLPFATVKQLPKEMILEIIEARSDIDIARIVYDTTDEVRNTMLDALPEIRREMVRSELEVMQANTFYEKRHKKVSESMQKDISRYLLDLYREGLLDLDGDNSSSETASNASGGENAA